MYDTNIALLLFTGTDMDTGKDEQGHFLLKSLLNNKLSKPIFL